MKLHNGLRDYCGETEVVGHFCKVGILSPTAHGDTAHDKSCQENIGKWIPTECVDDIGKVCRKQRQSRHKVTEMNYNIHIHIMPANK